MSSTLKYARHASPFSTPKKRQDDEALAWLPWAVWGGYTLLLILLSASHQDLLLNDSFGFFGRAKDLLEHPGNARLWVADYYPVGYPWLIAFLTKILGDAFTAARLLSVAGASGMLLLVLLMMRQHIVGRYRHLISAGVLMVLGANFNFLQLGSYDNTDMPAAALMLASVYWLGSGRASRYWVAGLWLGAAYLVRYTALTQVPALLVAILWLAPSHRPEKWRACALFLAGFVAVALVQIIPSVVVTGSPFFNRQAHNVWFALHGQGNWGMSFGEAVKHDSLMEIINASPGLFLKNYLTNLYKLLCYDVFGLPLRWLWLPGLVLAWLGKRNRFGVGAVGLASAVFGAAICLAFVTPRTTLFLLPVMALLVGVALSVFADKKMVAWAVLVALSLVGVGELYSNKNSLAPACNSPRQPTLQQKVTDALIDAGMTDPSQVLSLNFAWYHARHPYRLGFPRPWSYYEGAHPIYSPQALEQLVRERGYQYVISDGETVQNVPGLKTFWPRIPTNLRADTVFIENEVIVLVLRY